jgi:hypothetical protein
LGGDHLGARIAQVCERFIATGEFDHLHLVSLAWIHRFDSRKKLIHRDVNLNHFKVLARTRSVAHFVRCL